jgi:C-terminal processing protease CtpA/Prc
MLKKQLIMKYTLTILLNLTILSVVSQTKIEKRSIFSADEVKQDLSYLYSNLEASHFNLYVNNPKIKFDAEFERLKKVIKDSMDLLQISRLFQPFVALSKLAHCSTPYPFSYGYGSFIGKGGVLFPLDLYITNHKVFITENYSTDSTIKIGDEVLAIDGIAIEQKLNTIYNYLSGENDYFKNTLIDLIHFPRLWWIVHGTSDFYNIKVKTKKGEIITVKCKAINAGEYEAKNESKPSPYNTNRSFKFIDNIAYLQPGQFMNAESDHNTSDHDSFKKDKFSLFIDSCFQVINKSTAKSLIIDLRGNPGGDNSFSDEMVSCFANKPFWFCSKFVVKTSKNTKIFWKDVTDTSMNDLKNKILNSKDGEIFNASITKHPIKAEALRYKGKVFVLVNRYSYSNSVTTAAIIQDYKFGKVIGEQTADVPTTYGAVHEFNLPNTGMAITYPKAFMIRPNGDTSLNGLKPDFVVSEGKDILEFAIQLIKK